MKEANSFGRLVEDCRHQVGWTQRELAAKAGLGSPRRPNHTLISRLEHTNEASPETARAVIRVLSDKLRLSHRQRLEFAAAYLIPEDMGDDHDKAMVIGVLIPDVQNSFWSRMLGALEECAGRSNYKVVLHQHHEEIDQELAGLDLIETGIPLAGLILAPALGHTPHTLLWNSKLDRKLQLLKTEGVPTVFIDRKLPLDGQPSLREGPPYVGPDNELMAYQAVNHLIHSGHKRIAALTDHGHATHYQGRRAGYRRALDEAGLQYEPNLDKVGGSRVAPEHVRELLELPLGARPTAIYCGNYFYAVEVLTAVRDINRRGESLAVPDDFSVIGTDDAPELDIATPQVARICYRVPEFAQRAFDRLIALSNQPGDPSFQKDDLIQTFHILEKESISPPRSQQDGIRA